MVVGVLPIREPVGAGPWTGQRGAGPRVAPTRMASYVSLPLGISVAGLIFLLLEGEPRDPSMRQPGRIYSLVSESERHS